MLVKYVLQFFFSSRYYSPLQQAQAFYPFPFHQVITGAPNMEIMNEQQTLEGTPETNFASEPTQGRLPKLIILLC